MTKPWQKMEENFESALFLHTANFSFGQVLFSSKIIRLRNGFLIEYLWGTISSSAPRGKHGTTRSKLELLPSEQKSSLVTNPNWTRSNPSKSLLLLSNSPPSIFIVIASRCDTANILWLRDPQPKIVSITSPISNKIGWRFWSSWKCWNSKSCDNL